MCSSATMPWYYYSPSFLMIPYFLCFVLFISNLGGSSAAINKHGSFGKEKFALFNLLDIRIAASL
jgi:hypothetical protein